MFAMYGNMVVVESGKAFDNRDGARGRGRFFLRNSLEFDLLALSLPEVAGVSDVKQL